MTFRFALAFCASLSAFGQSTPPRSVADADRLEAQVEANPEEITERLQLLRYYWNPASNTPVERLKTALRRHAVWMIEHHPTHPALQEPWAAIAREGRRGSDPELFAAADHAWREHLKAPRPEAGVFANAANFYKFSDPVFAEKLAADGRKAYPDQRALADIAGELEALAILQAKSQDVYFRVAVFDDSEAAVERARAARRRLEDSTDGAMIGAAAATLVQELYSLEAARRGERAPEMADLAESSLKRAVVLDGSNPRWRHALSTLYLYRSVHASDNAKKIAWLDEAAANTDDAGRLTVTANLATAYLQAKDYARATKAARDLLELAPKYPDNWANGNAVHHGNIVLGRVALHEGDAAEAARRLLAAGNTKGSPQLNSFGPDWVLAEELLSHGDTETVLRYIELCRAFWKLGATRLDAWSAAIHSGGVPNFAGRTAVPKPDLAGKPAPALRLPKLKGGEIALESLRGKVVLLDFWATWCTPCRAEMPTFEKLNLEFAPQEVVILAVDVAEEESVVADYIAKQKFTFIVPLAGQEDAAKYGVSAYPTLVSIDREGKVVEYLVGKRTESELREVIARAQKSNR